MQRNEEGKGRAGTTHTDELPGHPLSEYGGNPEHDDAGPADSIVHMTPGQGNKTSCSIGSRIKGAWSNHYETARATYEHRGERRCPGVGGEGARR